MSRLLSGGFSFLFKESIIALLIKVFAGFASFLMSIVVARVMGAEQAGKFFLGFTFVIILGTLCRQGFDNALVRFIASDSENGRVGHLGGVVFNIALKRFCFSYLVCVAVFLILFLFQMTYFQLFDVEFVLIILLVAAPFGLNMLYSYSLQGLKRIVLALFFMNATVPCGVILFTLMAQPKTFFFTGLGFLCVAIVSVLLANLIWNKYSKSMQSVNYKPTAEEQKLISSTALRMFGIKVLGLVLLWGPQVLVGLLLGNTEVAYFTAAQRVAMLISFVLVAVNAVLAPSFARLHFDADSERLGEVVKASSRVLFVVGIALLAVILLFAGQIMLLFGQEFIDASLILQILAFGQFLKIITGSVGNLLQMTGNEYLLGKNLCFSAVLALFFCFLLIPQYGAVGAACASAIAVGTQNLLCVWQVRRIMGINTLSLR